MAGKPCLRHAARHVSDTGGDQFGKKCPRHGSGHYLRTGGIEHPGLDAEKLHSLGVMVYLFELGLLALFLLHIITGIFLYFENLRARPDRYAVNTSEGGRSWGSRTMPYSGVIILVFIIVHQMNFHFIEKTTPVSDLVRNLLSRPGLGLFYIFALLAVALHLSHGVWSLFQTIGLNHEKYNGLLLKGGLIFSILVGTVFILIPLLALFSRSFLL